MSKCVNCQQRSGEYICIQPECVKIQGNQMLCFQCYCQSHSKHTPKNFSEVYSLATDNSKKQIQSLEQMIEKNTKELIQLEQFLDNQNQTYIAWNDQQKKSIKECIEQQNNKLQSKIKEAKQILQQQNLDSILNYCLINANQQEVDYQKAQEQSNIERQFQINEITARINFIKDLKFSLSDLSNIFVNTPLPSIPKAQEKSFVKYQQCNIHQKPQKYLCMHNDCISQKSTFPFYCKSCFLIQHNQHNYKIYAKKYKFIKQEQDEKTQLITQEQEKIKSYMQQEFNKNCELIQKQLSEKMKKYDQIKSNMLKIKEQSLENLNKLINFKFIQNNINASLLSKNIQEIKQGYSIEYKRFCQKMSIDLQSESREIFAFTAKLDQKYEKEQNEISLFHQELKSKKEEIDQQKNELKLKSEEIVKLKNQLKSKNEEVYRLENQLRSKNEEINKLENQLNLNKQINSDYYNCFEQLQYLPNSQIYIQKLIDELAKNIKEKINSWIVISMVDRQFLRQFENNFKDIKTQITAAQRNIENIVNKFQQISNSQAKYLPNNYVIQQYNLYNNTVNPYQVYAVDQMKKNQISYKSPSYYQISYSGNPDGK
ncbi:unnamed protein product [Paramecium pentaurelia]|uniref:Uncharacterized protein n=1 Tax=Paramecium pentaurelia TaxID=43138 RepID=A0A8S1WIH5_9CILI|nr:unnamed protein product [Paramecium pentaurelia]